jgi:hypothetical protein
VDEAENPAWPKVISIRQNVRHLLLPLRHVPYACTSRRKIDILFQIRPTEGSVIYLFNVHGSVHRKNILIYVQQDSKLHNLFYLETALHVSGRDNTRNM